MADPPGAILVVQSGVNDPRQIPLDEMSHVLGRLPHADVGLENPFVSRKHAEIGFCEDGYFIRDLGSKNGTYVDGVRLGSERRFLEGGEIVEFGAGQVVATFALGTGTVTLPHPTDPRDDESVPTPPGEPALLGISVEVNKREVYVEGIPINPPLSRKEFDVLSLLYDRQGEACSKDEIAARGWPERAEVGVSDQEIGQCIHRIRRRIEPDPGAPRFVELIRGFGYRLNNQG
ncbi:MAG: FHA domain-containing protein [Chloroflexi bacterium]|nr:FHA domain-containing protein [Chloroflexota bacterium]